MDMKMDEHSRDKTMTDCVTVKNGRELSPGAGTPAQWNLGRTQIGTDRK